MRRLRVLFLIGLSSLLASPARACPMCAEAVPNATTAEEEEQARLSRAYNSSIYLMVAVPYVAVGAVGFVVYRRRR